jgi:putative IMPACT (imprinted ancient) family translation regulator
MAASQARPTRGGIKLGAGGLVRAYGRCVSEALDAIGVLDLVPHTVVTVSVDHHAAGRLEHDLRTAGRDITATEYTEHVTFHLLMPTADLDEFDPWLARISAGAADAQHGMQTLRAVPTTA